MTAQQLSRLKTTSGISSPRTFLKKSRLVAIPLVRIKASQKCDKGIHLVDLAKYLDVRAEAARKEMIALTCLRRKNIPWRGLALSQIVHRKVRANT
jgi:hypothetical protein